MTFSLGKDDQFVAKPVPWRLAGLAVVSLGFVVLGAWIAGLLGEPPEDAPVWAGWLGIIFFGFCAIVLGIRAFDREDVLRINTDGIWYRHHSRDVIPFDAIEDVGTWSYKGQAVIILKLHDPEKFPAQGIAGKLSGMNRSMVGGDVSITMTGLDKSLEEAFEALESFSR